MAKLFEPFQIKNLTMKNRIVMPPMCMYSANDDGLLTPFHFAHYGARIIGGVGTIILESTGVTPNGRITNNDLGLWADDHIAGLKSIVDFGHQHHAVMGIQLNHAGRRSRVIGVQAIAPTTEAFADISAPRMITKEEIQALPGLFQAAAKRALTAGFDFIEIHAAHGYLLDEFLSPLGNKRTDEYGGSEDNRLRLLKEIAIAIREVWPKEKMLQVRVSAEDYAEGGLHQEDLASIINKIKDVGIDMVNVSSGGVAVVRVNDYPGYQVGFAQHIRAKTGLPVIAGGLIEDPLMAEAFLKSGHADFIYFGRELLRNPQYPLEAARALQAEIPWPVQYERAKR